MARYVAFLRAVNVGGRVVKMDELRRLFESMGLSRVETFIASGNVIFESKSTNVKTLERKIEQRLQAALGYEVATFVRSTAELSEIARHQPFARGDGDTSGATIYVMFLAEALDKVSEKALMSIGTALDELAVHRREIYWRCRAKFGESAFSPGRMEKTLKIKATCRNSTTVTKMASKYPAERS